MMRRTLAAIALALTIGGTAAACTPTAPGVQLDPCAAVITRGDAHQHCR